jgi:hypothetical protein
VPMRPVSFGALPPAASTDQKLDWIIRSLRECARCARHENASAEDAIGAVDRPKLHRGREGQDQSHRREDRLPYLWYEKPRHQVRKLRSRSSDALGTQLGGSTSAALSAVPPL